MCLVDGWLNCLIILVVVVVLYRHSLTRACLSKNILGLCLWKVVEREREMISTKLITTFPIIIIVVENRFLFLFTVNSRKCVEYIIFCEITFISAYWIHIHSFIHSFFGNSYGQEVKDFSQILQQQQWVSFGYGFFFCCWKRKKKKNRYSSLECETFPFPWNDFFFFVSSFVIIWILIMEY